MAIGSTLGAYKILERLSTGGMGEIYLAQDPRLNRKVALKVLPSEWADDPDRRDRFQWEAQVLATLNHPNIVTIYSVEHEDDVHFFTMELVEGRTLAEMIPEGGLSASRLLDVAVPLAEALAAAHERGLIHRDIKPGNVMVGPSGRVKVLDFGLAKREPSTPEPDPENSGVSQPQTQDGRLFGTVAYMAPEQMYGQPIDHRSDIFALGVVLYEMATGSRPFQGTDWRERVAVRLEAKGIDNTDFNGGSFNGGGLIEPPLSSRLGGLILRCLDKDPEKRFQSADELRQDLEAMQLELRSGSFSATQTRPNAVYLWRRQRQLRSLGTVVAVLIVVGVLLWLRFGVGGDATVHDVGPKRIVILPFENLGPPEQDLFAVGITEEITSRLAAVSGLRVISRTTAQQYERSGRTAKQIGLDLGVGYLLEGSVRWQEQDDARRVRVSLQLIQATEDTQLWAETYDRVIDDLFGVQTEIAERVIRELDIALLEPERLALESRPRPTRNREAYEAYLRGMDYARRFDATQENWRLAAQMLERSVRHDPEFALAWSELSEVYSFTYHQIDRNLEQLQKARAAVDRALEIDPELPEGHRALGYFYYWGYNNYAKALEEMAIAAERLPNDSQLIEGIGYIRRRQGRFDEAVGQLVKAFEIEPRNAWLAGELARTYTQLRRYDLADHYYDLSISLAPDDPFAYQSKALNDQLWKGSTERTREILAEMPKQEETSSSFAWYRLAVLERDYPAALGHLDDFKQGVIGLEGAVLPRDLLRGFVLDLMGDPEASREAYEAARVLLESRARDRPEDARIRTALGLVHAGLANKEDAIREGVLATELLSVEKDAYIGPVLLINLAEIYARVGEIDLAVDAIERALAMPSTLSAAMLRLHPRWDPLRGQARFDALAGG